MRAILCYGDNYERVGREGEYRSRLTGMDRWSGFFAGIVYGFKYGGIADTPQGKHIHIDETGDSKTGK